MVMGAIFLFLLLDAQRSLLLRRLRTRKCRKASSSGCRNTAALGCNLNANERSPQRNAGEVPIHVGIARSELLFRPRQGVLGALQIDFCGALRSFREYRDAAGEHFGKTLDQRDRLGFLAAGIVITKLADTQLGD